MKTKVIISTENNYNKQKELLESLTKERKDLRKSMYTLTRLLHEMQAVSNWSFSKPIFEKCGLPLSRKVSKSAFLALLPESSFIDINGEKLPAITTRRKSFTTDEKGVKTYIMNGTEFVYSYRMTAIKDGSWSVDKIIALCCGIVFDEK